MNLDLVLKKMIAYDAGDARRIQHFLKVHAYAALIGREEHLPPAVQERLEVAAILHDIGIHAAEEKYGSAAGKYQEIEGPAPARALLESLGCEEALIEASAISSRIIIRMTAWTGWITRFSSRRISSSTPMRMDSPCRASARSVRRCSARAAASGCSMRYMVWLENSFHGLDKEKAAV